MGHDRQRPPTLACREGPQQAAVAVENEGGDGRHAKRVEGVPDRAVERPRAGETESADSQRGAKVSRALPQHRSGSFRIGSRR